MNMKRKKPLPQPKVKVDLTQAETLKCEKCGNYSFIQSFFLFLFSCKKDHSKLKSLQLKNLPV